MPVLSKATTLTPASVSTAAPLGKEGLGERRKRSPRAPKRAPRAPGHTARPRREASSRGKTRSLVPLLAETKEDRKPTTRGKTSQNRERGRPGVCRPKSIYEPLGWGPHSLGFADEADDFFAMRSRSPCVARASMAPQRFIVSESRMSPGSLEIGRDSPVRFDSSQAVAPFQQGPLAPRSDDSRACGHRQHQKMHIQPSLAKSRPRVFGCVPSAAHISRSVKAQRGQAVESICRSGNRPEKQAGSNEQGEAFPLLSSSANGRCSRGAYFGHFTAIHLQNEMAVGQVCFSMSVLPKTSFTTTRELFTRADGLAPHTAQTPAAVRCPESADLLAITSETRSASR